MPTLGEFVEHAKKYGFARRTTAIEGLPSEDRIVYLWRDSRRFTELPKSRETDRLTRSEVLHLCRRLGLRPEDFGLQPDPE